MSGLGLSGGANGVYTLSGMASTITTDLKGLTFTPNYGGPNSATTTTFTLSDASTVGLSTSDSNTEVTDYDAPTFPLGLSVTGNGSTVTISGGGETNGDTITLYDYGQAINGASGILSDDVFSITTNLSVGEHQIRAVETGVDSLNSQPSGALGVYVNTANKIRELSAAAALALERDSVKYLASTTGVVELSWSKASTFDTDHLRVVSPTIVFGTIDQLIGTSTMTPAPTGLTQIFKLDHYNFAVEDTAADIKALTSQQVTQLQNLGVKTLYADVGPPSNVTIDAALASELETAGIIITPPSGKEVVLSDTVGNLSDGGPGIDPAFFSNLPRVRVSEIDLTSGNLTLTIAEAVALEATKITLVGGSLGVSDTSSHIEGLSIPQIDQLAALRISSISATSGPVDLTVAQANELEAKEIKIFAPSVAIVDSPFSLENTLTTTIIDGLSAIGVTDIQATGDVTYSVAQTNAIDSAGLTVSESGSYTVKELTDAFGSYSEHNSSGPLQQKTENPDHSYDIQYYQAQGAYSSVEDIYNTQGVFVAEAQGLGTGDPSSTLNLRVNGLTVGLSGMNGNVTETVTVGADTFSVAAHNSATSPETIDDGHASTTFDLSSGFGNVTINDFISVGTTHDTLDLSSLFSRSHRRDRAVHVRRCHGRRLRCGRLHDHHGRRGHADHCWRQPCGKNDLAWHNQLYLRRGLQSSLTPAAPERSAPGRISQTARFGKPGKLG